MGTRSDCRLLSEFLLQVFESFWQGEKSMTDPDVQFALFGHALIFQVAFAVDYGLVDENGLSDEARRDITEALKILASGDFLNTDKN